MKLTLDIETEDEKNRNELKISNNELNITKYLLVKERKRSEHLFNELRIKENFHNQLFDSSNAILIVINNLKQIVKFNKAALSFLKINENEILYHPVNKVFNCDIDKIYTDNHCKICSIIDQAFQSNQRIENIEISTTIKQQNKWMLCSLIQFVQSNKKYVLITIIDNTKQKELELDLLKAKERAEESDRLKSAFLGNISHEIRTPLNGIVGFTEILFQKKNLSENEKNKFLEIIKYSSANLIQVVEDLVDLSRIETHQVKIKNQTIELNQFLSDIFQVINTRHSSLPSDVEIQLLTSPNKLNITIDQINISKVLIHLIDNAVKFTNKGIIRFGFNGYSRNGEVEIIVSDTGKGIAPEHHEYIFKQFTQIKLSNEVGAGNGLGLFIVKNLLTLMNYSITLKSELGKGSCFYITLGKEKTIKVSRK